MKSCVYSKEQWKATAKEAHRLVFDKDMEGAESYFDFAVLMIDEEEDAPVIYSTFQELSPTAVNMSFGGSFPKYRGSLKVARAFSKMVDDVLGQYGMVSFMTKNDNYPMLKLGFSKGFKVTGINFCPDGLFLENTLFKGEK